MVDTTNTDSAELDTAFETDDATLLRSDLLQAELPKTFATALGRLLGRDPIDTLGEWVTALRTQAGDAGITAEDLCHESEQTPHWGELAGERYHFACFYDAVVLASLTDEPVGIRTESPAGRVIEARAVGTEQLVVTPPDAVFSFGVGTDVQPPDREPTRADVYAAVCPYVRAFPTPEAYEQWARSVPARTVAMPLAGATHVAAALVA